MKPANKRRIKMADPYFNEYDRRSIHEGIDEILSGSLSMGPNVFAFENEFAKKIGVKHAIATNSCTSALEVALIAKSVIDREVIIPSETFIATAMAVHLSGGIPVFAEISESTLCLDFNDVKSKVNSKTAGVILVHMAGLITPDIFELRQFCDQHKLFLIEDVAHALGASYENFMAGSFGNIGCFSFYPTKIITCGEGGMLTTNEDKVAEIARSLQNRGRDIHSSAEVYTIPGRNIRMTEMSALLGRVQLNHLEDFIKRRRALASIYAHELCGLENVSILFPQLIESSSFWKFPVILNQFIDRDSIMQSLINEGIEVDKAYYPPLHLQPVFSTLYGTYKGMLPKTENILNRHIFLPCHPRMSDKDVIFVTHTLKDVIKNYKKRAKF